MPARKKPDLAKMTDTELEQRHETLQESIHNAAVSGQLHRMEAFIDEQLEIQREQGQRAAREAEKQEAMRSTGEKAAAIRAAAEREARIEANKTKVHEIKQRRDERDAHVLDLLERLRQAFADEAADQEDQRVATYELARDKGVPLNYPVPGAGRSETDKLIRNALARAGLVKSPIGQASAPDALTLDEAHAKDDDYLRPRLAALVTWQSKRTTSWTDAHIARTNQRLAHERAEADKQLGIRAAEDREHRRRLEDRARGVRQIQRDAQGRVV